MMVCLWSCIWLLIGWIYHCDKYWTNHIKLCCIWNKDIEWKSSIIWYTKYENMSLLGHRTIWNVIAPSIHLHIHTKCGWLWKHLDLQFCLSVSQCVSKSNFQKNLLLLFLHLNKVFKKIIKQIRRPKSFCHSQNPQKQPHLILKMAPS